MAGLRFFWDDRLSHPVTTIKSTYQVTGCTTTNGSPNITVGNVGVAFPGDAISGTNIPLGAVVATINSMTSITISANATNSGSGLTMTFTIAKLEDPDFPTSNLLLADPGAVWRIPSLVTDPLRVDFDFGVGKAVAAHAWCYNAGWDGDANFDVLYSNSYPARDPWLIASGSPVWTSVNGVGVGDHFEVESTSDGGDSFTGRRSQIQDVGGYPITARYWRLAFAYPGFNVPGVGASTKFRLFGTKHELLAANGAGLEAAPGARREWVIPQSRLETFSGVPIMHRGGRGRMRFTLPYRNISHSIAYIQLLRKLVWMRPDTILGFKDFNTRGWEVFLREGRLPWTRNFGTGTTNGVYDVDLELEAMP